jgi:hypothetical protein
LIKSSQLFILSNYVLLLLVILKIEVSLRANNIALNKRALSFFFTFSRLGVDAASMDEKVIIRIL